MPRNPSFGQSMNESRLRHVRKWERTLEIKFIDEPLVTFDSGRLPTISLRREKPERSHGRDLAFTLF